MFSGLSGYIKGVKNALHGTATQAKPTLGKIRVGNRDIEEIKLISQGGYAYVFEVRDVATGEIFALKKMICQSPERFETAKNEIRFLRSLPTHPNLLRVYDSSIENRDNCYYVYVLLEFCDGGSIFDLMAKYEQTKLSEKQMIFIMREVAEGVKVLHSCKPPIAHRDLKIENVLLRNKRFKLCDFGSCSTSYVDFSKVPQSQYANYEEEYEKNTTLMYRPPEMCDPYQRQIVCEKVDVWMLGCILYTMCFYKHPFQEMTKLSIVNAAYSFPEDHPYPEKLIDLIRIMLTPNPNHRPSVFEICDLFNNYFDLKSVKLNPDAQRIREDQRKQAMEMKKFENNGSRPKFNGDIPIEELMKLQKSLQTDDDQSPIHTQQFQQRGGNRQQQQPQQFKQHASKPNAHHFDSFDSFGQPPKRQQQPDLHQFNSSPGLQQSNNNDWADFKNLNNNTPKQNNQFSGFGNNNNNTNNQPRQMSSFSQNQGNGNQGWSNNQSNQPVKADNRVNEQWNNFNFNSTSSSQQQQHSNNNNNNSGNAWATSGWGNQNQQQAQSFNAFNSTPSNNGQSNNAWNNFGVNSGSMNNANNFQGNNNMMNKPQNSAPTVTNDLLDLADASANQKPNIMSLYAMNR